MFYPVIEITQADELEQLGTKSKFWFVTPEGEKHLCKFGRPNTGENWSEKAACELAKLLGIPCATYDLASFKGKQAVVSYNLTAKALYLVHGNELLAKVYASEYDRENRFRLRQYKLSTVINFITMLENGSVSLPDDWGSPFKVSGITELFIAYLLFDAWIGNQDRHDENWGIILAHKNERFSLYLSPSYDHASSLACRMTDTERGKRLLTNDKGYNLQAYTAKAKTPFFANDGRRLGTMEALNQAMMLAKKGKVMRNWFDQLESITADQIFTIFDQFPIGWLSQATIDFTVQYLQENKRTLLGMRA
ncbi:HipA domain-containing protein [Thiofilum flexile]|uniref:HipA domain-containing protein n=1 Tax=Thiofilum flexile TaxID=125627 RepID=UPI00038043BF|nr:HipA domain-containing protein [Thiofilum flexile]